MNWNLFLFLFYGKVFIVYITVGYLLVRYLRKGFFRFNPDCMIQCPLREALRKHKKTVDFFTNLIVIFLMIFVSFSFGLPALRDIPVAANKKEIIMEGVVVKGSNIESSNKLECYDVIVEEENGTLHDLALYWKNGIHKDDVIKAKYLPHSQTGIVIKIRQ